MEKYFTWTVGAVDYSQNKKIATCGKYFTWAAGAVDYSTVKIRKLWLVENILHEQ